MRSVRVYLAALSSSEFAPNKFTILQTQSRNLEHGKCRKWLQPEEQRIGKVSAKIWPRWVR